MKNFDELTKEQQEQAIEFAKSVLEDCLESGLFTSNRPLTKEDLERLSLEAAEGSKYDNEGRAIIGVDVPPFYLGGCV